MASVLLLGLNQNKAKGIISQNEECEFPGLNYLSERLFREGVSNEVHENIPLCAIGNLVEEKEPRIVGFSVFGTNYEASVKAANIAKAANPSIITVFGGPLPSNYPRPHKSLDYIVVGEGETTFKELCTNILSGKDSKHIEGLIYFENGIPITNKRRKRLATEDFKLVDVRKLHSTISPTFRKHIPHSITFDKIKYGIVSGSRGCVYGCDFCDNDSMWNRKVTLRSPEQVLDEVQFLADKGVNYIGFMDSDFLMNDFSCSWTTRLAKGIIERRIKLKYHVMANINSAIRFENMDLLQNSGCAEISLGMESTDPKVIHAMGKHFERDNIKSAVKKIYEAGIYPSLYVLFGHPDENQEGLEEQYEFLKETNWCRLRPGFVIPYPGTPLYRRVEEENLWLNGYRNTFELMTGDNPVIKTSIEPERLVFERNRLLNLYFCEEYAQRFRRIADNDSLRANKDFLEWLKPMVS